MMNERILKRKYGLTLEQFHKLLDACGRRCPACEKPFDKWTRPACVDHDHLTGLVRGLLCGPCNEAIGFRHDKRSWFRRVADYLFNPPAVAVIGRVYVPNSPGAEGAMQ